MSVQLESDPRDLTGTDWHAMTVDEVTEALGADTEQGLPATEITARQARYGPNALPLSSVAVRDLVPFISR